jgi:hypothetical protein
MASLGTPSIFSRRSPSEGLKLVLAASTDYYACEIPDFNLSIQQDCFRATSQVDSI